MNLPTDYQQYIHQSRYARWIEAEGRRETWKETVSRYFDFMAEHLDENHQYKINGGLRSEVESAVLELAVMPSMRALMTAGPALRRNNVAGYNCSYLPVDSLRAFDEAMFILLCGTGVGFSVESQYVSCLPTVNEHFEHTATTIMVADSKEGWCRALRELIAMLYAGQVPKWDMSQIRPAGARLKTFGGRASGPGPLVDLFEFVTRTVRGAKGRKLTTLEAHDILCKIGDVVVVGGVRRSAMISLSDLGDDRLRVAKSGAWWEANGYRALANNSYVLDGKPDMATYLREMSALYDSHAGERGIFSRSASQKQAAKNGRRDASWDFGTNPCSEIVLRPYQFCNLTECVVRSDDGLLSLSEKVHLASVLGTWQSTLTGFRYLRHVWRKNTEEERLLGVSLTGIMDNSYLLDRGPELAAGLQSLRAVAIDANWKMAQDLCIPQSTAVTCVKPSGTVSQLVDSASGIHPRHAPFYVRTVRSDNKDPLTAFLADAGVPNEPDVTKPGSTTIFSFPQRAPEGAALRDNLSAVEHLELWKLYQDNWTEHKPSVTIYYRDDEFPEVAAWIWKHLDSISGISLLPYSDHVYKQAPYQPITEAEYYAAVAAMPTVDWARLAAFEAGVDSTTGTQELACSAGGCEI